MFALTDAFPVQGKGNNLFYIFLETSSLLRSVKRHC